MTRPDDDGYQSKEEIERDIMRRRMRLGDDVDALVEKVSPRQAARRQVGRVTHAASTAKERIMGTASDLTDTVKDKAHGTADAGHGLADRASDVKDSAADAAGNAASATRRKAQGNPLAAGLIAFGVGWLASSLIPASRPEQKAGAALKEHAEPVKQAVTEKAKEVGQNLKEPAQQAAQQVKETATGAAQEVKDTASGHADSLKEDAKDRAGTVQETARQ
ncbi:DUF3618 domain-containing protein [Cryptosporangium phraense]|uniref:DUF3618 domain-containing protein n=1 Tax=Cryptosporangium phraense TaxID=2593070 RepID=A0A545AIC3_9ACTN|nr:DUF3618 domain-containing protein [Cryptosporangium phraense]TQS41066.1 DUF3618 domain-containing protein [Cryptosporangium phraense]